MSNLLKFPQSSTSVRKLVTPDLWKAPEDEVDELSEEILAQEALQQVIQEKELIQSELQQLKAEREKLKRDLEQMKNEAREEIATWWEQEQQHLEKLKQEAFNQGYEQGLAEGQQEGLNQYRQKLVEAEEIVQTAYRERLEMIRIAEAEVLQLSISIARKVMGEALNQPEHWQPFVTEGLKAIEEQDEVIICLPAPLYPQLLPYTDEWAQLVEGSLKVIPDSTLKPDQCLIKTKEGTYDLSLDQQLSTINKQLMACFEERIVRDQQAGRVPGSNRS